MTTEKARAIAMLVETARERYRLSPIGGAHPSPRPRYFAALEAIGKLLSMREKQERPTICPSIAR